MANSRKDSKGRVLRPGESEWKDGYYIYQYQDVNNIRRVIYNRDLVKLRNQEDSLTRDLLNGIDIYTGETTTLNEAFDRYIAGKSNLKQSTRTNYKYMYDNYVRPTFGNRRLAEIKYSDVKAFYQYLIDKKKFKPNSMEIINTILHPVFTMAHRDGIIRINPSDGIMSEIKKSNI